MKRLIIFVLALSLLLVAGCSLKPEGKDLVGGEAKNNEELEDSPIDRNIKGVDNTDPNELIEYMYKGLYPCEIEEYKKILHHPESYNLEEMQESFKDMGIVGYEVRKSEKVAEKKDYIIYRVIYNIYYEGIQEPKPDMEFVTLFKENDRWVFVNNHYMLEQDDMVWMQNNINKGTLKYRESDEMLDLMKEQKEFEENNKEFLEEKQKEFEETY